MLVITPCLCCSGGGGCCCCMRGSKNLPAFGKAIPLGGKALPMAGGSGGVALMAGGQPKGFIAPHGLVGSASLTEKSSKVYVSLSINLNFSLK
ncbi:unnamed protein product [Anisakis simplex]|uniref:Secreted protein n=1 Tax=Anisakis simplex TaxID=6269 RepID=A0A0M3K3H1_ANISI|nr:unnamed protein product [Anisakis simplex]